MQFLHRVSSVIRKPPVTTAFFRSVFMIPRSGALSSLRGGPAGSRVSSVHWMSPSPASANAFAAGECAHSVVPSLRGFARSSRRGPSAKIVSVKAAGTDNVANSDDDDELGLDDFYSDEDLPAVAGGIGGALTKPGSKSSSDELALLDPMKLLPESGKCLGCGIDLQCEDENGPGFFKVPERLLKRKSRLPPGAIAIEPDSPLLEDEATRREAEKRGLIKGQGRPGSPAKGTKEDAKEKYGEMVEDWLSDPNAGEFGAPSGSGPLSQRPLTTREARRLMLEDKSPILCARCYSLKHEGRVKRPETERALPGFDLLKAVGPYLAAPTPGKSTVVVAVVDAVDFDGSVPRSAIRALWPKDREGNLVRPRGTHFVLVVNKVDLLPPQVSAKRLQEWVKRRARQAGLPEATDIHLVSAQEGAGINPLLETLEKLGQPKGNIFVVGAQNAGKSTLLNAMRKAKGLPANLTEAALPGTTIGLIKVNEVFPHYIRLFDTPGVPHPYQLSARLTPEEVRMLLPRKQLKARTFAMKMRQTLLIGGLARVDVRRTPGTGPIYVTLWASWDVSCWWGTTENADEFYDAHVGKELAPPVGDLARIRNMGALIPSEISLEGESWKESAVDVHIAGLGWIAVAVDGRTELDVWAHDGVAITTHQALVPDFAKDWERPGYDRAAKMLSATRRAEEEAEEKRRKREEERAKRKGGDGPKLDENGKPILGRRARLAEKEAGKGPES